MRKIIVYIATSADGYIARPDGDVSWLDRPHTAGDYGIAEFYKSIDTVLMGRKTYDFAASHGQKSYPAKKNYVFSRSPGASTFSGVEFVNEDPETFAERLRARNGKDIWLVGGGELIGAFLDAGQVDEFIIHVIPTFIGEGIPLIHPRHRSVGLRLLDSETYADGVLRIHYSVRREASKS